VARDATEPQVKAAYRSLMGQYHADRVSHLAPEIQGFAKRKAQAINRAYDNLKRARGWK
jgi:curved DNA-binding protein CbpA